MDTPFIINFQQTGSKELGFLDIAEVGKNVPFDIKRSFWTHSVPNGVIRGHHAHKYTKQILIAIKGKINVTTEMPNGDISKFVLTNSNRGVYLPPHVWHHMEYLDNAVQIVFCSAQYDESDYLRNYEDFKSYHQK